jgi:glycosyltransferase involved in cell wall biosynthesis
MAWLHLFESRVAPVQGRTILCLMMPDSGVETPAVIGGVQAVEQELDVSVVIPCLNEEESVAIVVKKALEGIAAAGLRGEVVVADNNSEDASRERAEEAGARVVIERRRGYGSAYLAGLAAARGRFCVMADADDTYDVTQLGALVAPLEHGADMVLGSRFKGQILPGAMPWSHRWIGNPILTGILNWFFHARVSDAHCGLRAVRRDALPKLKLSATGMEFASEMVIKAAKRGLRIEEVPIVYHPRIGESKLSSFSDAWRHIRFMLVHTATYLFVIPGALAAVAGVATLAFFAADPTFAPKRGLSVAIAAAIISIVGVQVIQLGLFAKTYSVLYLGETEPKLERLWDRVHLEQGLLAGAVVCALGLTIAGLAEFDSSPNARLGLLGLTLLALGAQAIFGSFFLSVLGLSEHAIIRRRRGGRVVEEPPA